MRMLISISAAIGLMTCAGWASGTSPPGAGLALSPEAQDATGGGVVNSFAEKYKYGLYWCCNGSSVTGSATQNGLLEAAAAFTPAANSSVTKITVALSYIYEDGYTSDATVALYSDNNGSPGTQLASADVTVKEKNVFMSCCGTTTATIPSTSLNAGMQYWVVITPSSDTTGLVWNISTVDQVHNHTYAYNFGGKGWTIESGELYNAMKVQ